MGQGHGGGQSHPRPAGGNWDDLGVQSSDAGSLRSAAHPPREEADVGTAVSCDSGGEEGEMTGDKMHCGGEGTFGRALPLPFIVA